MANETLDYNNKNTAQRLFDLRKPDTCYFLHSLRSNFNMKMPKNAANLILAIIKIIIKIINQHLIFVNKKNLFTLGAYIYVHAATGICAEYYKYAVALFGKVRDFLQLLLV